MSTSDGQDLRSHWNRVYEKTDDRNLGWYELEPIPSIELIKKTRISKHDKLLIVGAGKSTFVDWLVQEGYSNIYTNDISEEALRKLRVRIKTKGGKIESVVDDLTAPHKLKLLKDVRLWHDRAVLHFITREEDQKTYFKLLRKVVSPGGFVIIGEFSKLGPNVCSGLPVLNYSVDMISEGLGHDFYLIDSFNYDHKTPLGELRPYIYALFCRHSKKPKVQLKS